MAAADGGQSADPNGVGLTFGDFLAKMKDPAAADLVRNIKSFIRHFEERPAGQAVDPEVDSTKVQAFLGQSEATFRQHPVWRGCQAEVVDQAVEGLEKYVMSKVWRQTFGQWQEDRERDERYQRLMQALGFVDLPTLMGVDVHPDNSLLALAQGEVLKMDRYKAPRDKLLCLVNVKTMVENIVQLAARGGANIGGADAFFPVFLFVVLRSRLPRLASNIEYIKRFRMRARLAGQFDYMLCNLESTAMWLDTVNYEHLGVTQQAFLEHLAAAGIPEAHLELSRMQQEAALAAAAAVAASQQQEEDEQQHKQQQEEQQQKHHQQEEEQQQKQAADLVAEYSGVQDGSEQEAVMSPRASAAAASVARAAASGAAAAQLRHEQKAAGVDDASDVLAGLQLADGGSTDTEIGPSAGLESAQTSVPVTPLGAGALGGSMGSGAGGDSGLPELTPQGTARQSPVLLEEGDAGSTAAEQQQDMGAVPRELTFEAEPEQQQQRHGAAIDAAISAAAAAGTAAASQQQQEQQQQWQWEQYSEPGLIEEMVVDGTRHVLAAEAAGQLQQRYPFMYAAAEDLSLEDAQAVLTGYKELLLRYEALSRALQQQLGLIDGGAADSSETAATAAGAAGGHRTKQEQQRFGFGSLILPGLETSLSGVLSGRPQTAPLAVPGTSSSPTAVTLGSADASPSGKWSPGGILQRIRSKRSMTPPRDRDGDRPAAAAAGGPADGVQLPAGGRVPSPGKQGQHPFFSTLFGSSGSKPAATQQPSPPQVQPMIAGHRPQQPGPPLPQQAVPAAAEAGAGAASPELSFAEDLSQRLPMAGSSSIEGSEAGQGAAAVERVDDMLTTAGAELADLIQLDSSKGEEEPHTAAALEEAEQQQPKDGADAATACEASIGRASPSDQTPLSLL